MTPITRLLALLTLLLLIGCASAEPPPPAATPDPIIVSGIATYEKHCGACHSSTSDSIVRGPSLIGVATRASQRVDGLDARTYLYTSLLDPSEYIVEGFDDIMPKTFGKTLTGEELDSVIAYLLLLK